MDMPHRSPCLSADVALRSSASTPDGSCNSKVGCRHTSTLQTLCSSSSNRCVSGRNGVTGSDLWSKLLCCGRKKPGQDLNGYSNNALNHVSETPDSKTRILQSVSILAGCCYTASRAGSHGAYQASSFPSSQPNSLQQSQNPMTPLLRLQQVQEKLTTMQEFQKRG